MDYDISALRKFVSPEIVFGAGSRKAVANFASNFGARHVFLVSDPGVEKAGWVSEIRELLFMQAGLAKLGSLPQIFPVCPDSRCRIPAS